jgi:type I restriction enzyme R subunit
MSHFNKHNLEMTIRELLERQGYEYQSGETIHKKLSEVMLLDDLYMFLMERYADE